LTAGGSELPMDASSFDLPGKIAKIQSDIEENNRMRVAIGEKIDNFDVKSNKSKDKRKLIELQKKRTTLLQVSMQLQESKDEYVVMQQLIKSKDDVMMQALQQQQQALQQQALQQQQQALQQQNEKFLLIQKARFRTGGLVTILFVPYPLLCILLRYTT
jgi:hypothetical protein